MESRDLIRLSPIPYSLLPIPETLDFPFKCVSSDDVVDELVYGRSYKIN